MLIKFVLGAVIGAVVVLFAWAVVLCLRMAERFERDIVRLDDEVMDVRLTIENLYTELKGRKVL